MLELDFRRAGPADAPILVHLYAQLDPSSPPAEATVRALLRRLEAYPDYAVWLASRGRDTVGTFAMIVMETLGTRCRPAAVVEDVVVEAAARGAGIGRAMMEFAMQKARAAGCYKLVLSSNLRREQAHAFYDSLGFRRHGYSFVVDPEAGLTEQNGGR